MLPKKVNTEKFVTSLQGQFKTKLINRTENQFSSKQSTWQSVNSQGTDRE